MTKRRPGDLRFRALSLLTAGGFSAVKLAVRLDITREDASRLLQSLKTSGFVEHRGAWMLTIDGIRFLRTHAEFAT